MTVGWGVIGAGGIANRTIPDGILEADNAAFVGVTDIHAERARATADRFGGRVYETVEDMLADDRISAVYLATPPFVHAEAAVQAARAGKHVLSEKPMAISAEQAEAMVQACAENGVILGHATMMRFNAYHRRMKDLIDAGEIGKPLGAHARYSVWWNPNVPQDAGGDSIFGLTDTRQIAWRQTKRIGGGGPMLDDGVHALDTMVFLLGRVGEVFGFCDTLTRERDVEDMASVLVKFRNGAQGMMECYSAVPNFQGRRVLRVYGDEAQLLALGTLGPPSDYNRLFRLKAEGGELYEESAPEEIPVTPALMYETQFRLFSDAVEGGEPFPIPGEEGLHIQRVIDGVFRSSETRQAVSIEE